jgi:hypothetical protein
MILSDVHKRMTAYHHPKGIQQVAKLGEAKVPYKSNHLTLSQCMAHSNAGVAVFGLRTCMSTTGLFRQTLGELVSKVL